LNPDGTFSYTHDGSETTTDSFTFMANDGTVDSPAATVSITVNGQNDAPTSDDGMDTVDEGMAVVITLTGDDVDGDALTFFVVSGPSNGSLGTITQLTPTSANVTYTHDGSETTTDSFTFRTNDGTVDATTAGTVTISVTPLNDPPVANATADTVNEGNAVTLTLSGSDIEGDALTFAVVAGPSNGSLGAITQLTPTSASVTYTHDGSETTADSFTFRANDGTDDSTMTATATLTINPVNDPPVADAIADAVNEGNAVTITLTGSDADGDSLTFSTVTAPTNGSLGGITQLTPTSASVTYTHDGSETVVDSFTFRVNDGTVDSTTAATVSITVNPVNDPPVSMPDTYQTVSNTQLEVGLSAVTSPVVRVTGNVIANDSDAEMNALTVTGTSGVTAGASVVMNTDGTFTYTPPVDRSSDDSFNYTLSDGLASTQGTVTIQFFNQVWFVDNTATAGGQGRSSDPFDTLAEAAAVADANDVIFVHTGDGTTTGQNDGIILQDNLILTGEGVVLEIDINGSNTTLLAAGTAPTLGNASGDVIEIANDNVISGIDIEATMGAGIRGNNDGGTTTLSSVSITNTGTGNSLDLNNQSGAFSFSGSITGTSSGDGIEIANSTSGTFTFAGVSVEGHTNGIDLTASIAASFVFSGTTTLTNNTARSISLTGDGTPTTDASVSFNNLSVTSTMGNGINLATFDGSATFTSGTLNNAGGRAVSLNAVSSNIDFSSLTFGMTHEGILATGSSAIFTFPDLTVTNPTVDAISLTSNTGATFNFNSLFLTTTNTQALRATGGGTLNLTDSDSTINTTGASGVELNGVTLGASNITFASITVTSPGANEGLDLDSITGGTFNVTGTTMIDNATTGIDINASASTFTFATLDISGSSNRGVSLTNNTGVVNLNGGTIDTTSNAAFAVDQGNANVTFAGTITNTTGRSVEVTNRTGATVSIGSITGSGTGLLIQNNSTGSPVIQFTGTTTLNTGANPPATISTNTGATVAFSAIDFDTTTATGFAASATGMVAVTSGTVNTTNGEAVNIANCGMGITFTSVTGANASGNGVSLSTNTGSIAFGALDITNTGGTGFLANNSGIIAIAGSANDIITTTGVAVNISNTTIAGDGSSGGINLNSVSASNAVNGIYLDTTGSGRFVVTGDGSTAGSGGTIQNISNNGIELRNCNNISLAFMNLTDANTTDNCGTEAYDETGSENCRGAIYMNTVMHPTFNNLAINETAEQGIMGINVTHLRLIDSTITNAGNSTSESAINIRDLLGTSTDGNTNVISGCTITNSAHIGIFIRNLLRTNPHTGDFDRLEITNTTVTQSGDQTAGDNITISLRDDPSDEGANMQVVVSGCTLTGNTGEITDAIQFDTGINARGDFQFTGTETNNCNTGINLSGSTDSTTTFSVENNPNINVDGGIGINVACNSNAVMIGTIANNTIYSFNANNPANGINVTVDGTGTATVEIDNNTVTDFSIPLQIGARNAGVGTGNFTVTNNTMSSGGGFAFGVLYVFSGNGNNQGNVVCLNVSGNNFNDPFGTVEYYLEQYTGNTFSLQGYMGIATSAAAIETFIEGNNVAGDAEAATAFGGPNMSDATCSTPN
jgi:hypothetical protein